MKRTLWGKALILACVAFLCITVAVAVRFGPWIYAFTDNPFNDEPFTRSKWMALGPHTGGWRQGRGPMAEDLQRRFLHKGMRRGDVRTLLGNASGGPGQKSNEDWYYLGVWAYMSIDGDYLVVRYDGAGRVVGTDIYTH
jgi:hypothetical protein